MTIYLNALGIVCAPGSTPDAVRRAVLETPPAACGETSDRLTPGRRLRLGSVAHLPDLPDDVPPPLRSRNNALAAEALRQIRAEADRAIAAVDSTRVAVIVGTSTSGIHEADAALAHFNQHGQWPAAFHYQQLELGSPAAFLANQLGTQGPAYTLSTACSSGAKALAAGARLLQANMADVVIAGGVDTLCRFTLEGFSALEALSPDTCNPMSANRHGIHIGEGAALFLMTRETGPVALTGWGETSDAYHMSAPEPSGTGATLAIEQALQRAGLTPADIDYINLHGTATQQNDLMECAVVNRLFGETVPVSSTKPLTGHALGAAGAIEAGFAWLILTGNPQGALPPHWWDGVRDPALAPLKLVQPGDMLGRPASHILSQSFAFGGNNATLILSASPKSGF